MDTKITRTIGLALKNPKTFRLCSLSEGRSNVVRKTGDETKIINFSSTNGEYLGTMHRYRNGAITSDSKGDFLIYEGEFFGEKKAIYKNFKNFKEMAAFFREKILELTSNDRPKMTY